MNPNELADKLKAWKPPPLCDRVGCGALHPAGTYHGPATLIGGGGELEVISLVRLTEYGWEADSQIIQVFTGSWFGDATLRFPDGSTAKVTIGELRLAKGSYAELELTGVGSPPAILWPAVSEGGA